MKVEMHAHTSEVSPCGLVPAKVVIKEVEKSGYDGIIITDHYNDYVLENFSGNKKARVKRYLQGYEEALEAGEKYGVKVLFGVETNLSGGMEDYLIYGLETDFLFEYPDLYKMTPLQVSNLCKENQLLFLQAHPFRSYCKRQNPELLDGIEVLNGNPRHNSHNDKAKEWAKKYPHLILTSGSDYHNLEDVGRGGVVFNTYIEDNNKLITALRQKEYRLIQ